MVVRLILLFDVVTYLNARSALYVGHKEVCVRVLNCCNDTNEIGFKSNAPLFTYVFCFCYILVANTDWRAYSVNIFEKRSFLNIFGIYN